MFTIGALVGHGKHWRSSPWPELQGYVDGRWRKQWAWVTIDGPHRPDVEGSRARPECLLYDELDAPLR